MAGILASRRGELAPNFIEQAEQTANMVSILGPHPSTRRNEGKQGGQVQGPQGGGSDYEDSGGEGGQGATVVEDLATDLFGDSMSVAETAMAGAGGGGSIELDRGHSLASRGGKGDRHGSVKSMSRLDSASFMGVAHGGSTADGLPPLQLRQSSKARALGEKRKLQHKAGFDDSFSRNTPRVLQEMSRTDPGGGHRKRKPGLGGSGGSQTNLNSSSQSIVGGRSVASIGSQNSKASRQLNAGSSIEDTC